MATRRWAANRSTVLALKDGETNLGGGHDDHIPSGRGTFGGATYRMRGAVLFPLTWGGVGQIQSAVLSVKTTSYVHVVNAGADPDIYVRRIVSNWNTNSARSAFDDPAGSGWTGASADYGDVQGTSSGEATKDVTTSANTWDTVDITDIVEAWAPPSVRKRSGAPGGDLPNYGLLIRPVVENDTSENTEFWGVGQNATSVKPSILLTYTDASSAPTATITAPTGTVATSTPTIAGTYSDPESTTMSKLDIQVSTVTTFASTVWDVQQTTVFGRPSATTWQKVYAGSALTPGTTYYIRARVYDAANIASAWSSTVSFVVASFGGGTSITPAPPSFRQWPARIELYDMDGNRGPGTLKAVIDDAKNIGVSDYANEVGECYFTIPYNHPQISEIKPLERHIRVSRFDASSGGFKTLWRGLLDDFDADQDEAVVYGSDYKGLLETSITAASTTYTSIALGTIVLSELTAAIAESGSRIAFTSASAGSGLIEATADTAILMTAFQPRLQFIQQVANVSMSDSSVRTIFSIPRDAPYTWKFIENQGSEELTNYRLEYGGHINGFRYNPNFRMLANRVQAIGVRREGASILYSTQSTGSIATYGRITVPALFQDVVNQGALDEMTKRSARVANTPDKRIAIALRVSKVIPWTGFDLGDNFRLIINRGSLVNINSLFTLWGTEWTLAPDGTENLYLSLATKLT